VFKRLNDSCFSFRLKNVYISDNNALFIAPSDEFCKTCFTRRYLTQVSISAKTNQIEQKTLELAKQLDNKIKIHDNWCVFFLTDPTQGKDFEFVAFEDCQVCGRQRDVAPVEVQAQYTQLLKKNLYEPDLDTLISQVFSFGFAKGITVLDKVGLENPEFDKLLGDLLHARIIFRMIGPDGISVDSTSMGVSTDVNVARLKSLMEYLERYAFMLQVSKYKTNKFDINIIEKTLALYKDTVSDIELCNIKSQALWGLNLSTKKN
jgi:hypothetical protein